MSENNTKVTKNWIIRGCVAAVFLLPVITTPSLIYEGHVGKWLLIAGVITFLLIYTWLKKNKTNEPLSHGKNFGLLMLTLYGIVVVAWSFLGDPIKGLLGDALRLNGAWMWILMIGFAWWLSWWANTSNKRLFILRMQSLAAVIVVGLAILVQFAPEFFNAIVGTEGIGWDQYYGFVRIKLTGLWGSSTYLAAYVLMSLFLMGLHVRLEKTRWIKKAVMVGIVLAIFGVWGTGSRGSQVGVIIGLVLMGLAYLQTRSSKLHVIIKRFAVAALLCVTAFVYLLAFTPADQQAQRPYHPMYWFEQLDSQGGISTRLLFWSSALDGIKEKPLLGWGHEMYETVFDTHYKKEVAQFGLQETWTERAHNQLLEVAVTTGLIGLLVYLLLIISPLLVKSKTKEQETLRIFTAGIMGAYAGFGLFAFNTPSLILHLALIVGLGAAVEKSKELPNWTRGVSSKIVITLAAVAVLFVLILKPWMEAKQVQEVRNTFEQGDIEGYEKKLTSVLAIQSMTQTDTLKILTDDLVNNNTGALPKEFFVRGIPILLNGFAQYNETYAPRYAMQLREVQLKALSIEHVDTEKFKDTIEKDYDDVRALSPDRQTVDINQMNYYMQTGQLEKARELVDTIVLHVPSNNDFQWTRVIIMSAQEQTHEAGLVAAQLIRDGRYLPRMSHDTLDLILVLLEEVGDYTAAFQQLNVVLNLSQENPHLKTGHNFLRKAYAAYNLEAFSIARTDAMTALELDAVLEPQVTDLIARIKTATQPTDE